MIEVAPYSEALRDEVVALSLRAWAPVFDALRPAVPSFVYRSFYPEGWEARQTADIEAFLRDEGGRTWVALETGAVVGWVGVRLHPRDRMGEVYILAVDPDRQRRGVASSLLDAAFDHMRAEGMAMAMVETGGDPGHAPSRATYERNGFERWPVARYFREL